MALKSYPSCIPQFKKFSESFLFQAITKSTLLIYYVQRLTWLKKIVEIFT